MIRSVFSAAVMALFAGPAGAQAAVCVENGSVHSYFFAAEAGEGSRVTGTLTPGRHLCAEGASQGARGVVSVFESISHLEGCSRLTPAGQTETLVRYSDFDRCEWASHSK